MRSLGLVAVCFAAWAASGAAFALETPPTPSSAPTHPSTLDKVKEQGFLRCGGVRRPGLAMTDGDGQWSGLEVEVCRAVATAVFGASARYAFHDYGSDLAFDAERSGEDQLSFLTFAEMADHALTDKVLPGPPVFVESLDMLVAESSPAKGFGDMAGHGICFMIGTSAENALEAWFHDHALRYVPFAFQEDGEEDDAFNVGKCQGLVAESTTLGKVRLDRGINDQHSRFLADHFLSYPVLATTPLSADAPWAAIVAWTIATLLNADVHETDHHAGGLRAMTVGAAGLGLPAGWQTTVVDRIGSYSDIFRRTLGAGSPLKLDQGLNRRFGDGGVLVAPFRD